MCSFCYNWKSKFAKKILEVENLYNLLLLQYKKFNSLEYFLYMIQPYVVYVRSITVILEKKFFFLVENLMVLNIRTGELYMSFCSIVTLVMQTKYSIVPNLFSFLNSTSGYDRIGQYVCLIFLLLDLTTFLPRFHFSNSLYNQGLCDSQKRCKRFYLNEEFKLPGILCVLSLGFKVYCLKTISCHDLHLFSRKQPTTIVVQFIY